MMSDTLTQTQLNFSIEEFKYDLEERLRALDHTQQSIEQTSHWLSHSYESLSAQT